MRRCAGLILGLLWRPCVSGSKEDPNREFPAQGHSHYRHFGPSWKDGLKHRFSHLSPLYTALSDHQLNAISDLSSFDKCLLTGNKTEASGEVVSVPVPPQLNAWKSGKQKQEEQDASIEFCSRTHPKPSNLGCAPGIGYMGAPFELNQGRGQCHGIPSVERPGLRARLAALESMAPHQTYFGRLTKALQSKPARLVFLGDSSNLQVCDDLEMCGKLPAGNKGVIEHIGFGRRIDDGLRFDLPFDFHGPGFSAVLENALGRNPALSRKPCARTIIVANFGLHYSRGSREAKNPFVNVSATWTPAQFADRYQRDVRGFGEFITTELLPRNPHAVVLWHGSFSQHFDTPIGDIEDPPDALRPRSGKCIPLAPDSFGTDSGLNWRDQGVHDEVKRLNHPDVYFLPMGRLTRLIPPEVHPGYVDCTHLCKAPFAWEGLYWALTEIMEAYENHEPTVPCSAARPQLKK